MNNHTEVKEIIESYGAQRDSLISMLQDIQTEYNYLPQEALETVSGELELPMIQVYSVATFFRAFSLEPRGEHSVCVCMGTACHVRGAPRVLEEIERQIGVKSGETTEDMKYTLETVNCLGACALGPVVVVDGQYFGQMNAAKGKALVNGAGNSDI
ncbi:MAG: NAD(P)H-dependent oxidoreductase subunit E [Dehalococcoidia bacterium]